MLELRKALLLLLICTQSLFLEFADADSGCWATLQNANNTLRSRLARDDTLKEALFEEGAVAAQGPALAENKGFSLARLMDVDASQEQRIGLRLTPEDRALADKIIVIQDGVLSVGPAYAEFQKATHARSGRWLDSPATEKKLKNWIDDRMNGFLLRLSSTRMTEIELQRVSEDFIEIITDIESIREARPVEHLISRMENEITAKTYVYEPPPPREGGILSILLAKPSVDTLTPSNVSTLPSPTTLPLSPPRLIVSPFAFAEDSGGHWQALNDALRPPSLFDFAPTNFETYTGEANVPSLGSSWDMSSPPPRFEEVLE